MTISDPGAGGGGALRLGRGDNITASGGGGGSSMSPSASDILSLSPLSHPDTSTDPVLANWIRDHHGQKDGRTCLFTLKMSRLASPDWRMNSLPCLQLRFSDFSENTHIIL